MATQTGEVVKDKFVIYVDDTTAPGTEIGDYNDSYAANLKAVALCQDYSINESGETEETQELADENSEWSSVDVTKKSGEVTFSGLLFRTAGGGDYSYDDTKKVVPTDLAIGDTVFFGFQDYDNTVPDGTKIKKYGKGVVTSKEQSGSVGSAHTYNMTVALKGPVLDGPLPAA